MMPFRKPASVTIDNYFRLEFYNDFSSYLIAIVEVEGTMCDTEIYADLEELTVTEMRKLWNKLKIDILPPNFMEHIRASVLTHLQNVDRVDLVAVCLDSVDPMEDKKRL